MTYAAEQLSTPPTRAEIDASKGWAVLEFGTDWCPHCLAAQPFLQTLLQHEDAVAHYKVEDGPGKSLGRSFKVKLWPTVIFLHDGQERARVVRPTDGVALQQALAQLKNA